MAETPPATTTAPPPADLPVTATWLILQRIDDLRRSEERLTEAVEELRRTTASLDRRLSAVEAKLSELAASHGRLTEAVEELRRTTASLESTVTRIAADQADLRHAIASLDAKMDASRREYTATTRWVIGAVLLVVIGFLIKLLVPGV